MRMQFTKSGKGFDFEQAIEDANEKRQFSDFDMADIGRVVNAGIDMAMIAHHIDDDESKPLKYVAIAVYAYDADFYARPYADEDADDGMCFLFVEMDRVAYPELFVELDKWHECVSCLSGDWVGRIIQQAKRSESPFRWRRVGGDKPVTAVMDWLGL